jgi:hypothetical protein
MHKRIIWSPRPEIDSENIIEYLANKCDESVALKSIDLADFLITRIAISL